MKVKDLIKELADYNMDAEVEVTVNGYPEEYEINCTGGEGVQKHNAEAVVISVRDVEETGNE